MATHSSILVGLTPWSEEEPGRLQSMGLQRVGHDLVNTTTSEPMTIQKTCSRLSLFSPLFRARAWRCLRLGLAFRVVDIPQSGLLAQIISLR